MSHWRVGTTAQDQPRVRPRSDQPCSVTMPRCAMSTRRRRPPRRRICWRHPRGVDLGGRHTRRDKYCPRSIKQGTFVTHGRLWRYWPFSSAPARVPSPTCPRGGCYKRRRCGWTSSPVIRMARHEVARSAARRRRRSASGADHSAPSRSSKWQERLLAPAERRHMS